MSLTRGSDLSAAAEDFRNPMLQGSLLPYHKAQDPSEHVANVAITTKKKSVVTQSAISNSLSFYVQLVIQCNFTIIRTCAASRRLRGTLGGILRQRASVSCRRMRRIAQKPACNGAFVIIPWPRS